MGSRKGRQTFEQNSRSPSRHQGDLMMRRSGAVQELRRQALVSVETKSEVAFQDLPNGLRVEVEPLDVGLFA
jgi:hypothetical protein